MSLAFAALLDELLAALIGSNNLPDVFGRISAIAQRALNHDAAVLVVGAPGERQARVHASSGLTVGDGVAIELPDALLRPEWEHDTFDDLTSLSEPHAVRFAGMGFRSLLRVGVRTGGRFAGVLIFLSRSGAAFTKADRHVAQRIAERMASTLERDRALASASARADEATARATRLEARVRNLTEELDARSGCRRVVGQSAAWREVLTQAAQVASTDATVLVLGESGTGKEVVARFLHRASPRKNAPFVALNCAALPEQLLEAELFGYERGAFTGATQSKPGQLEQAAGGTLFLDEVGEMSPSLQAKFLRVLQEREFQRLGGTRVQRCDVRVVAATNRDLQRDIAGGRFREDLFYRLNVFPIRLPALRDRRDDILPLSEAFLADFRRTLVRPPAALSREAQELLLSYQWPGNVRELKNILERASILSDGDPILPDHLAIAPVPSRTEPPSRPVATCTSTEPLWTGDLHSMERAMIAQALQSARFNKSKAAMALGLTRHQLYIRIRKYGLD